MTRAVIVGASAAGLSTAEALRRRHFDGDIVVIGEESGDMYDRPPLSKQVLCGEWDETRALLFPRARLDKIGAELRLGTRATGVDLDARSIRLADGDSVSYDELVIATGVRPRPFPGPGAEGEGVFMLRTLDDSQRLATAIRRHPHLLIVGAGFLGLEVAATARKLGAEVTVIEPISEPLASRLGQYTAGRLIELHRSSGVEIRPGVGVASIMRPDGAVGAPLAGVQTSDGELIEGDIVLVAIGCVPNVEWLQGSGLDLTDGVGCDSACQAAPHVWAAGDVARWYHPGLRQSLRLEHRMNASEQGAIVAANITGETRRFAPVPFFWTDHYATKVQLAGVIPAGAVERSELEADDSFVRTFWSEDRLVGVVGWNAAKAMMPFRQTLDLSEPAIA